MEYIDKSALVAEIERLRERFIAFHHRDGHDWPLDNYGKMRAYNEVLSFLDTLEVKEVDEQKERMSECPYRKVGCTMYKDKILECNGACSWIVDYFKLKELKAQKGE